MERKAFHRQILIIYILNNMMFSLLALGQTITVRDWLTVSSCICTFSGSTYILTLFRLYNPSSGRISLEGQDLESLNIPFVRAQMGLVPQEPTLFNRLEQG